MKRRKFLFNASLFRNEADRQRSEYALSYLLGTLLRINMDILRRYQIPPLYRAGVRYIRETSEENFACILDVIENRGGDCEDLACWRVAELRMQGIPAKLFLRQSINGGINMYHVLVRLPNGQTEDPSRILGMGRE